jgi:thioredoxin 1
MATVALSQDNFSDTIDNSDVLFIDFWAGWCQPCMRFGPIYEAASEKPENADVVFAKIDTEAEQALSAALEITSIPTIMAFRAGYLVFRQPGMLNGSQLSSLIEQVKGLDPEELRVQAEAASAK